MSTKSPVNSQNSAKDSAPAAAATPSAQASIAPTAATSAASASPAPTAPSSLRLLPGRVAIITGGTRGIGLATARLFAQNGARVIIFGSRAESVARAQATLASEGLTVAGFHPDLSDFSAISATIDQIIADFGQIDILVNNAGISADRKITDTPVADFEAILDLNLTAVFRVTKAVVPGMQARRQGIILNTSSMVSIHGQPSGVGYPASKSAINGLTKSLARELAPFGIRVNAVAPGIIATDMVKSLPEAVIQPLIQTIPLGRIGQPADIANAFLFLASDLASYITGEILSVDAAARS